MGDISTPLLEKVKRTIARHGMLSRGDSVLIAVSGGPDSTALAHVLTSLRAEYELRLHIAHLNHMFRGRTATADAEAVTQFAHTLGVTCTIEASDVPARIAETGESPQAGAREVRYAFLERVAGEVGANRIALGHNADDQAETVLMNLLRGAGPAGLAGIPPVRDGRYIRPLLDTPRAEIEAYCQAEGLSFRIDESNLKPVYLRNRVRLELLPLLKKSYNPNLTETLGRTAALLRQENSFLDDLAREALAAARLAADPEVGNHTGVSLRLETMKGFPVTLARRVLRLAIGEVAGGTTCLESEHIEAVLALVREGRTGARLAMPGGVTVRREYLTLAIEDTVRDDGSPALPQAKLEVPGRTSWPPGRVVIETWVSEADGPGDVAAIVEEVRLAGPGSAAIDLDQVEGQLVLRGRRPGDRFEPLGAPGERKLKEFLIDGKVPRGMRDEMALLADAGGILWVVGLRTSARGAIGPKTARILRLRVIAGRLPSI